MDGHHTDNFAEWRMNRPWYSRSRTWRVLTWVIVCRWCDANRYCIRGKISGVGYGTEYGADTEDRIHEERRPQPSMDGCIYDISWLNKSMRISTKFHKQFSFEFTECPNNLHCVVSNHHNSSFIGIWHDSRTTLVHNILHLFLINFFFGAINRFVSCWLVCSKLMSSLLTRCRSDFYSCFVCVVWFRCHIPTSHLICIRA